MRRQVHIIVYILFLVAFAISAQAATSSLVWTAIGQCGDTTPNWAAENGWTNGVQVVWNNNTQNPTAISQTTHIVVKVINSINDFKGNITKATICRQDIGSDCVAGTNVSVTFNNGQRNATFENGNNQTLLSDAIFYNFTNTTQHLFKVQTNTDYAASTRTCIRLSTAYYGCGAGTVDLVSTGCGGNADEVNVIFEVYNYTNETAPPPVGTGGNSIVSVNFSNAYNIDLGYNFTEAIELINWSGTTPTCNVTLNSSATLKCSGIPINTTNASIHCQNNATTKGERFYEAFVTCGNGTRSNSSANRTFWVDSLGPTLTTAFFLGGNNSYHYLYLNGSFTWTDSNLYRLNVTIDNNMPVNEITGINTTTYTYVMNHTITNLSLGVHQLRLRMADSHTAGELTKEYGVSTPMLSREIRVSSEKQTISIKEDSKGVVLFNPWSYKKVSDRIKFSYQPDIISDTYTFTVTTNDDLYIVEKPDTPYKMWIVSGDNWIDFMNTAEPDMKVSMEKTARNAAKVVISGLKNPLEQNYDSIGELNVVTTYYNFTHYNISMTYDSVVTAGEFLNSTLNITTGAGNITGYTYNFVYNNTVRNLSIADSGSNIFINGSFNAPLIQGTTENVVGTWQFNTSSENTTISFSQAIYTMLIDTCVNVTNTTAVNITFYDESSPATYLFTTAEVAFTCWKDPTFTMSFSYNHTGSKVTSIRYCLFPNTNLTCDAYFKYVNEGGYTHRYYLQKQAVSNATICMNAYNHNTTTGISLMRGTIRYVGNYSYFTDVLAKLQRYYVSENVWREIQHEKSDEYGMIVFNVIEKSVDYRISYYDADNHLLDVPERLKFSCTSALCEVNILLSSYGGNATTVSILIDSTYNNVSKILNVSWRDATAATKYVRALVTQDSPSAVTTICDTTIYASSGNITCNLSGYTGIVGLKVYSSQSPVLARLSEWIDLGKAILADVVGNNDGALWGFFLIAVFAGAGMASGLVGTVLFTLFGIIALYYLGLFSLVTLTSVIILGAISAFILIIRKKES